MINDVTLILLTWRKWWAPNNVSKQQMGFNSAFKGLRGTVHSLVAVSSLPHRPVCGLTSCRGEYGLPSCVAELFEFVILTSVMSPNIVVIPNRRINLRFGLRRGWSAPARPITNVLPTSLKTTDPASHWSYTYGVLTLDVFQPSMNLCNKQHKSPVCPCTHVHNFRLFALPHDWLQYRWSLRSWTASLSGG